MSEVVLLVIIGLSIFFLYKWLKPYFLKYDTTILFTGGVGSGKSLNSVKLAIKLYQKQRSKVFFKNLLNKIRKKPLLAKPELYSNMPIKLGKNKYCKMLTKEMLILDERIVENSVVLIDEMSAIVNQYNWNNEDVKFHLNEFIQFFRHYVGGYLITNAQAESEIVKQVRAKLNSYFWCFNFQKFLFIFYRVRILHSQITENNVSINSDFIEEKTKWTYGILTNRYNSRYLKYRYLNIENLENVDNFKKMTYNKIVRFEDYKSKCDDKEKEK